MESPEPLQLQQAMECARRHPRNLSDTTNAQTSSTANTRNKVDRDPLRYRPIAAGENRQPNRQICADESRGVRNSDTEPSP